MVESLFQTIYRRGFLRELDCKNGKMYLFKGLLPKVNMTIYPSKEGYKYKYYATLYNDKQKQTMTTGINFYLIEFRGEEVLVAKLGSKRLYIITPIEDEDNKKYGAFALYEIPDYANVFKEIVKRYSEVSGF